MSASSFGLGPPIQLAYVVLDVREAARRWAQDLGAGPFLVNDHIPLIDVIYRGAAGEFDHSSAYGQWGPVMVELVQDHGVGPSVVRERFGLDGTGLHHLAFAVDDLEASVQRFLDAGHEIALSARTANGTAFHFVDLVAAHGHYVELYERSERLERFYGRVAHAAAGWDGSDPVRAI